jgi:hypothetical protein
MLFEVTRSLNQCVSPDAEKPSALYAPQYCWVATWFTEEEDHFVALLANKATGFCVLSRLAPGYFDLDEQTVMNDIRRTFIAQGYDPVLVDAYLNHSSEVCFTISKDRSWLNRLSRWVQKIYDSSEPIEATAATLSKTKVQIDGKKIVPVEEMKRVLVSPGQEILKELYPALSLKISLRLTEQYTVFRSFSVPISTSFAKLHEIIQIAFDWENMHLHQFQVGPYRISASSSNNEMYMDEEEINEEDITLEALGPAAKKFLYIYDFGDNWEHLITVGKRELKEREEVICTDGAGVSPWEDCGGPYGYHHIMQVLSNPEHPQYQEIQEWTEDMYLHEFSKNAINMQLKGILKRPARRSWLW